MKRLLILLHPDPRRVTELVAAAKENDIQLHELLPSVFLAEAGPRGILEKPLLKHLAGASYVLTSYTAARANVDRWQNLLGPYGESRVGQPSEHDRYLLLHRFGGKNKVLGFAERLAAAGVSSRELAPGLYISQPTAAQASTFSAKLGKLVEEPGGDIAVVRFGPTRAGSFQI